MASRIEWSRLLDKELEETKVAIIPGKYRQLGQFRAGNCVLLLYCGIMWNVMLYYGPKDQGSILGVVHLKVEVNRV